MRVSVGTADEMKRFMVAFKDLPVNGNAERIKAAASALAVEQNRAGCDWIRGRPFVMRCGVRIVDHGILECGLGKLPGGAGLVLLALFMFAGFLGAEVASGAAKFLAFGIAVVLPGAAGAALIVSHFKGKRGFVDRRGSAASADSRSRTRAFGRPSQR